MQWAIRVPPNRSVTRRVASSNAVCGERWASTVVKRVSVVAKANAGGQRQSSHQVEIRHGVRLHRTAHVAHDDDRPWPAHRPCPYELHRLPTGAPGSRGCFPQRYSRAAEPNGLSARASPWPVAQRGRQPTAEQFDLLHGQLLEGQFQGADERGRQPVRDGQFVFAVLLGESERRREGLPWQS